MRGMALLVAACVTAGCVSVLPDAGPAPEIYRLNGSLNGSGRVLRAASAAAETQVDWIVVAPEPLAPRALATDRIAVMLDAEHISYAAGARWNERAPRMVQDRLLSALETDPRMRAAVRPEDGVRSEFELRLELRRFEAVYRDGPDAPPTIEAAVRARLVDRRTRELVDSSRMEATVRADANRLTTIVKAFDAAMSRIGAEMAGWVVDAGEAYERAREGAEGGDGADARPPARAPAAQPSASAASSSR